MIEMPASFTDRMSTVEQRAVVIEVGPSAWHDEKVPRAAPGDHVLVAKYSGHQVLGTKDGVQYRVVNARDVFLGLDVEDLGDVAVDLAGAEVKGAHASLDQGGESYVDKGVEHA